MVEIAREQHMKRDTQWVGGDGNGDGDNAVHQQTRKLGNITVGITLKKFITLKVRGKVMKD